MFKRRSFITIHQKVGQHPVTATRKFKTNLIKCIDKNNRLIEQGNLLRSLVFVDSYVYKITVS